MQESYVRIDIDIFRAYLPINYFPRQSLKEITFRVKPSDLIFFMLDLSPIVNQFNKKSKS